MSIFRLGTRACNHKHAIVYLLVIGSEHWPSSMAGKDQILCLILSSYGFNDPQLIVDRREPSGRGWLARAAIDGVMRIHMGDQIGS